MRSKELGWLGGGLNQGGGGGGSDNRHAGSITLFWGRGKKTGGFWSKLVLFFRRLN